MASAAKRSSEIVVPRPISWRRKAAAYLIYLSIRCMALSMRKKLEDASGLVSHRQQPQAIFAIWHNRLALSLMIFKVFIQQPHPSRRLAAMVSASRDGGLVARVLELFGVQPVRGSSSRRGAQALLEFTTWAEQGYDLAITPDGPRGPCYVVQEGVVALAQLTGLPIVPVSYRLSFKFRLKSWDRFQVPLPFSRWTVRFGEPLRVPREATDAQRDQSRQELERRMKQLTED